MIGIYFSGTGNSKYCIEKFLQEYDSGAEAFSIENEELLIKIREHEDLVFSYPVQFNRERFCGSASSAVEEQAGFCHCNNGPVQR